MEKKQDHPRRLKVVTLMWCIAHYRAPVFRQLSQNPHLDFVVWAGDNSVLLGGETLATANDVGKIDGVNWQCLEARHIKGPIFHDYEWQPEAIRRAWREDIDVLIMHSPRSVSNWIVRLICRLRGIPMLEWAIGTMRPEHGIRWAAKRLYMRMAKAQLLYGDSARDFFAAHGYPEEELFVVHNSLDHDKQVAIREKLTPEDLRRTREEFGVVGPNDRLLCHTGRLAKRKKLDLLCRALKRLKDNGQKVILVIIGDGPVEQELRQQAAQEGVADRVVFYGPCYDEEALGRMISAADLCVAPRQAGLIAMHSLVYGTPLLLCENTSWVRGPETEAVVNGETGAFFRENDVEDLARKMDEMLYPEPCKPQMSEACKRMIDTYYTPAYQERVIIDAINYVVPPEKRVPRPAG